jgi:hypothetical protein
MSEETYITEPAMKAAQQYSERNRGIPVDPEVAFTDCHGQRNPKCEKRQKKLLAKASFIRPYLDEDEHIILVTTACSPFSMLEQMLGGWMIVMLKRSLLVFTNKRFFHVPTTPDFKFRRSLAVVEYGWCQEARVRGGGLRIVYHNGKKEHFTALDRRERKKLKSIFESTTLPRPDANAGERSFLCPHCGVAIGRVIQPCANCGQAFRDKKTSRWLSLLLPGGGYFYTGHPLLGIADALVETYLTVYVFIMLLGVLQGAPEALPALVIFAAILALEKAVTIYESDRFLEEFLPKQGHSPYARAEAVETSTPQADVVGPQSAKANSPEAVLRAGTAL